MKRKTSKGANRWLALLLVFFMAVSLMPMPALAAEAESEPEAGTITVSLSILGDTAHGEGGGVHTLADKNLEKWLDNQEYEVDANATVFDLLIKAMGEAGITFKSESGAYGAYITEVTCNGVTLDGMTNGATGGWMFTINGVHGFYGVSDQHMESGDVIVFHYTDDYSRENYGTISAVIAADLIYALPEVEELTLEDAKAVMEAQEAFQALTEEDKAQITADRKEKLEQAVARITELQEESRETLEEIYQKTAEHLSGLADQYTIQVGTTGGEWMVIGLARAGVLTEQQAAAYYANAKTYIDENINDSEQLHRAKSTDNSRVVLGLTAIGKDVTNVNGHNLLAGLADLTYLKKQGINGPVWALIALDSHDYEIPALTGTGVQVTRENLVETILEAQLADGGWTLAGTEADPDLTAMAIQALIPYCQNNHKAEEAVNRAVEALSALQNTDGSYTSKGIASAEACAQVIVALTALDIDPAKDSRFVKNGKSVLDALLGFYVEDGGFAHMAGDVVNGMATEQAYYALTAYYRMEAGEKSLFDMRDVTITKVPVEPEKPVTPEKPDTPDQPEKPNKPVTPNQPEKPEKPATPNQPEKKVYNILDGKDGLKWTVEKGGNVTICADGALADFQNLKVDGNLVDPANYTLKAGSTIVTLKSSYLKALGKGEHVVTFVYKDGETSMTLPLGEGGKPQTKADLSSPQTGDEQNDLFVMIMLAAAAGMAVVMMEKKRREGMNGLF